MCRSCVNRRPFRHIFHRFQNVPASCNCSLNVSGFIIIIIIISFQMLRHKIEEADVKSRMQDEELKKLKNLQNENDVNAF